MESIRITKRTASTIEEVAGIALEHIPMTFSASDLFPGRKVFFPIPMKKNPKNMCDFIYVYAESKLSGHPKDKVAGFTDQDIIEEAGVYLFKKNGTFVAGCTYPIGVFIEEVLKDLSVRNRMIYKITEMRNMVHLDESFLDLANLEYRAKDSSLFSTQRLQ